MKEVSNIELQHRDFLSQTGEEGGRKECFSSTVSTHITPEFCAHFNYSEITSVKMNTSFRS